MCTLAILFSCAAIAAVLSVDAPALAQSRPSYASDHRAHPRRPARVTRPQGHIACGKYGCHPIPPGCRPVPGFDWRGNPTGYDVTVCR